MACSVRHFVVRSTHLRGIERCPTSRSTRACASFATRFVITKSATPVANDPEIADAEFDALLKELQDLEAAHPELS